MHRRDFLRLGCLAGAAFSIPAFASVNKRSRQTTMKPFPLGEATIDELQSAMTAGKQTGVSLTKAFIRRIREIDRNGPGINSVIEINPDALAIARALDIERKKSGPRGPMHGIPVLIKDNIDTHDRMMTTAGSLALLGSIAPRDSFVAKKLRDAGAVILGKTNLSEWANFRGHRSSSGWSGRGGQTKNPYALDRQPSGSSSGSAAAVAAGLCAVAVGTETDGSIISPSSFCGIVGIKPTVGLVSRSGIIPISATQDTAGPMARTVRDAAILLGALAGEDANDLVTAQSRGKSFGDYTTFLDPNGLRGARLGVLTKYSRSDGSSVIIEAAVEAMKKAGATIVELPKDVPLEKFGSAEYEVLVYEFKDGLNKYFASLGPNAPIHSIEELIAFNERNKEKELAFFGQQTVIEAQGKGPLTDQAYLDALEKCRRLSRAEGIDAVMDEHKLDAFVAHSGGPAPKIDHLLGDRDGGGCTTPAAVAGYPSVTVPAGDVKGMPVGICFFGRAYTEGPLLKLAYAFEQLTKARKPPTFQPCIG
jgi:amidase